MMSVLNGSKFSLAVWLTSIFLVIGGQGEPMRSRLSDNLVYSEPTKKHLTSHLSDNLAYSELTKNHLASHLSDNLVYITPANAREVISSLQFPEFEEMASGRRSKPLTLFVEGIIGTGKSTLLDAFQPRSGYVDILPEPVDEWTNLNGTDVLKLIFADPNRWAATQESLVMNSDINEHLRRFGLVKAQERSIYSARFCFIETLMREGKLTAAEYAILDQWHQFLTNQDTAYPTGFDTTADITLYLQTRPEVANERINGRGRSEEVSKIPMSYLQHLHRAHEDWLIYRNTSIPSIVVPAKRIFVINTENSLDDMMTIYKMLAEKIWESIPSTLKSFCRSQIYEN